MNFLDKSSHSKVMIDFVFELTWAEVWAGQWLWKMKNEKRCQFRSRLIYTTVVLIQHNHCPAQTSAQVSSKTKSIITFEWIDLSKKFKRLYWLELNFPLNCLTVSVPKLIFVLQKTFLPRSDSEKLQFSFLWASTIFYFSPDHPAHGPPVRKQA